MVQFDTIIVLFHIFLFPEAPLFKKIRIASILEFVSHPHKSRHTENVYKYITF